MIDYKYIKELVEKKSEIEDIGIKSRKTFIRDCRYVYAKLCFKYIVNFGSEKCGKEINRDHSTILHALKVFKRDYKTEYFSANLIYESCDLKLKSLRMKEMNKANSKSIIALDLIIEECQNLKRTYLGILNIKE